MQNIPSSSTSQNAKAVTLSPVTVHIFSSPTIRICDGLGDGAKHEDGDGDAVGMEMVMEIRWGWRWRWRCSGDGEGDDDSDIDDDDDDDDIRDGVNFTQCIESLYTAIATGND